MIEIIIYILLGIGVFFNLLAGVGLLRFPDVYYMSTYVFLRPLLSTKRIS